MIVYFVTKTQLGFGRETEVTFSFDLLEFQTQSFRLTELPAILAFVTVIVRRAPRSTTLTIHSRHNRLRDAFEKKWIESWAANGFKTKPRSFRQEWAGLYQLMRTREINFEFRNLDDSTLIQLRKKIPSNKPRHPPIRLAPGDPGENPWRDDTDINDAIDRAIKKDR